MSDEAPPGDPSPATEADLVIDYAAPARPGEQRPLLPNPAAGWAIRFTKVMGLAVVPAGYAVEYSGDLAAAAMALVVAALGVAAAAFAVVGLRRSRPGVVAGRALSIAALVIALLGASAAGLVALLGIAHHLDYGPTGGETRRGCLGALRSIHAGCIAYAQAHNGAFPPDLAALVAEGHVQPWALVCHWSPDAPAQGPTTQAILADLARPGRCSYVYVGAGLTTSSPPKSIVAYDRPANHEGKAVSILYADGTTAFLTGRARDAFLAAPPAAPASRPAGAAPRAGGYP